MTHEAVVELSVPAPRILLEAIALTVIHILQRHSSAFADVSISLVQKATLARRRELP
jgi:hypothetical protein